MKLLHGISEIADKYDHYILDIWGVLHNGLRAYPKVVPCLKELKKRGKQILLLTNSPNRAHYIPPQLDTLGISADLYDFIISSGESTHHALEDYADQNIFCFYKDEHPTAIEGLDMTRVYAPEVADVGLISHLPRLQTFDEYRPLLERCLAKNLPVICANPDKVVDVGGNLYPCAGGVADLYEEMGGQVSWHGKPHAPVYEWAMELLGHPDKSRVLAIGDSLRTDVTGAVNFDIDVLWNAVGIHLEEIYDNGEISEDKIKQATNGLPHLPTAVLNGLAW